MAYVGSVYTQARFPRTAEDVIDEVRRRKRARERPEPQHKHVWAEMTRFKEGEVLAAAPMLFFEILMECCRRDPANKKPCICVMDGERQLWKLAAEWFPEAIWILDLFHALKRLWEVAHCLYAEESAEAGEFVTHHLRMLLQGKVGYVLRNLRPLVKAYKLKGANKTTVESAITYYENNQEHMRYDEYLAAGLGVNRSHIRHLFFPGALPAAFLLPRQTLDRRRRRRLFLDSRDSCRFRACGISSLFSHPSFRLCSQPRRQRPPHGHTLAIGRYHQQFLLFFGRRNRFAAKVVHVLRHLATHVLRRANTHRGPQPGTERLHRSPKGVLDAQPLQPVLQNIGILSSGQSQGRVQGRPSNRLAFPSPVDSAADQQFPENRQVPLLMRLGQARNVSPSRSTVSPRSPSPWASTKDRKNSRHMVIARGNIPRSTSSRRRPSLSACFKNSCIRSNCSWALKISSSFVEIIVGPLLAEFVET